MRVAGAPGRCRDLRAQRALLSGMPRPPRDERPAEPSDERPSARPGESLPRKSDPEPGLRRVDAAPVVPAPGDDDHRVPPAEPLVHVLRVRLAARLPGGALRHRRARTVEAAERQDVVLAEQVGDGARDELPRELRVAECGGVPRPVLEPVGPLVVGGAPAPVPHRSERRRVGPSRGNEARRARLERPGGGTRGPLVGGPGVARRVRDGVLHRHAERVVDLARHPVAVRDLAARGVPGDDDPPQVREHVPARELPQDLVQEVERGRGRVKRVYAQADAPYRMVPKDIEKLYVRNTAGKMVPFSSFASSHWTSGSPRLERFNGFPSMNIWGEPAPGRSSGEAMQAMEEIVAKLPQGIGFEWTGLSYQERSSSSQAPLLYAFSIIVIFLCVAALYESWPIPIANLLMLPLGVFGGTLATSLRGLHNDVYFQIGFLTTLGLTTKNAILIIQFARERMAHGEGLIEATLGAARVRLRPVIMTSLAFFFGVLPLAIATGAGAGAMKAIGTAVTGGMLSATFIDLFYIPLFFVLVSRVFKFKGNQPRQIPEHRSDSATAPKPGEIG